MRVCMCMCVAGSSGGVLMITFSTCRWVTKTVAALKCGCVWNLIYETQNGREGPELINWRWQATSQSTWHGDWKWGKIEKQIFKKKNLVRLSYICFTMWSMLKHISEWGMSQPFWVSKQLSLFCWYKSQFMYMWMSKSWQAGTSHGHQNHKLGLN